MQRESQNVKILMRQLLLELSDLDLHRLLRFICPDPYSFYISGFVVTVYICEVGHTSS